MNVKVIKRYVDRNTKELMNVGGICEYPQQRARKLAKDGYVEIVQENLGGDEMGCKKGGKKKK